MPLPLPGLAFYGRLLTQTLLCAGFLAICISPIPSQAEISPQAADTETPKDPTVLSPYITPRETRTLPVSIRQNQPLTLTLPTQQIGSDVYNVRSLEILTQPQNGSTAFNVQTGVFSYTPIKDYAGSDTTKFQICYTDTVCIDILMEISVQGSGDQSLITQNHTIVAGQTLTVSLAQTDKRVSRITIDQNPSHGTLATDVNSQSLNYTPQSQYQGSDSLIVTACYLPSGCQAYRLQINVTGASTPNPDPTPDPEPARPPLAQNDTQEVTSLEPISIPALQNDQNPIGGIKPADFRRITRQPQQATVEFQISNGQFIYTPNPNANGEDSFVYEICNSDGCSQATVNIRFNLPQTKNPPVANDDTFTFQQIQTLSIDILSNDEDLLDGIQTTDFTRLVVSPTKGEASLNTQTGKLVYTPKPDFTQGQDVLVYELCNPDGCDQASLTLTANLEPIDNPEPPVPHTAIAKDDQVMIMQGEQAIIKVLQNDDLQPANLVDLNSLEIIQGTSSGELNLNRLVGEIIYTPKPEAVGQHQFVYQICLQNARCTQATVYLFLEPNNQTPQTSTSTQTPSLPQTTPSIVRTPAVLGVLDSPNNPKTLARTGGNSQIHIDALIALGFLSALAFFNSLYFQNPEHQNQIF